MADATLEQEIGELTRTVRSRMDEVKSWAETHNTELKNLGKTTDETRTAADKALSELGEVRSRLSDAEQKLARRGTMDDCRDVTRTIGGMVVEHDEFRSRKMDGSARTSIRVRMTRDELKDVMSGTATWGTTTSGGNALTTPDRRGMLMQPEQRLTIRDLLLPGTTASNAIEYPVESLFTNNAAPVAEGALKPKSDIAFDMRSTPIRTIAHIFKASRQILDDAPQLRTYIDGRGRYGLKLKEEQQLLTGNGTGANLLGLIPQASAYALPAGLVGVADPLSKLRAAILQVALTEFPASGIVLNPVDLASIELLKDADGRFIYGDPQGAVLAPRLWNLPVVDTIAMAQNSFLTGAFNIGAQIFDRMEVEVLLSTENEDDFARNMVTIRIEERLGLAVYRPASFVVGTLTVA
jgi:HK97 family phage major capsid protein